MQVLKELEIGVMFWAGRDPVQTVRELRALGVRCGQMALPGDLSLERAAAAWKRVLDDQQFQLVTIFAAYAGESYADMDAVRRTVGFVPPASRDARERRTREVSDFAAELGVPAVATHIGVVPEDDRSPDYLAVLEMVRRVCDYAARNDQAFALETGQESAETLRGFILEANRPNLHINFDPANLILYGTGDPIQALEKLGAHVISVHCKDGDWPPRGVPGALGEEQPLGRGSVGIDRFVGTLERIGYRGPLVIEREGQQHEQWLKDLGAAVALLERLRA